MIIFVAEIVDSVMRMLKIYISEHVTQHQVETLNNKHNGNDIVEILCAKVTHEKHRYTNEKWIDLNDKNEKKTSRWMIRFFKIGYT